MKNGLGNSLACYRNASCVIRMVRTGSSNGTSKNVSKNSPRENDVNSLIILVIARGRDHENKRQVTMKKINGDEANERAPR